MLFMVIETFRDQDAKSVYRRMDFEIVPVVTGKETVGALSGQL